MAILTIVVLGCFIVGVYQVPNMLATLVARRFVRQQPMVRQPLRVNYFHFENGDILEETIEA